MRDTNTLYWALALSTPFGIFLLIAALKNGAKLDALGILIMSILGGIGSIYKLIEEKKKQIFWEKIKKEIDWI